MNLGNQTIIGIDGKIAGEKAILQKNEIIYCTSDGFKEILEKENVSAAGIIKTADGRIFSEYLGTMKKMILCGGGHVSLATLSIGKIAGFHITVVEDRLFFAEEARRQGADQVICDCFKEGLDQVAINQDTFVVVMTRGHRHDMDCLRSLLEKEYGYLGMMGSKSRVKKVKDQLKKEGYQKEKLDLLHAPVGLNINASTPAEIAVSIMAEIIKEKNVQKQQVSYEKEVADWLFFEKNKSDAVMAMIIHRKGSVPRSVGTKMLIFPDGKTIGTIGGGCMEGMVVKKARHMMADGKKNRVQTCFVDMTELDAEEEGMVCGGTLEIFLEIL